MPGYLPPPVITGARQSAAAVALGAPKGVTRGPGKAAGKPPGRPQPKMPGKAPAKTGGKQNVRPGKAPAVFNPTGGPGEDVQLAKQIAQQTGAVERAPLQAEGRQIAQNEAGASQRYGQYAAGANQTLAGIASQNEASAKTFENQAADNALQQGKAIETAGQNAASMTAGYMTPELKAQLQAEGNRESAAGAAGNTFAQNSAQASGNLMAGIRGAAALKATEGQSKLTGFFQKQQNAVQSRLQGVTGKEGALASKLLVELPQKQFTNRATASGLGIKVQQIGQKASETKERVGATERGQNLAVQRNRENSQQRENNDIRSAGLNRIGKETAQMSAEDKKRYDEARVRIDSTGKAASPKEGRSYMSKLSSAEAIARGILGKTTHDPGKQAEARAELLKKGASGDVISAALNLAVYGRLGASDQAAALSYGMTPSMRPQWFRTH